MRTEARIFTQNQREGCPRTDLFKQRPPMNHDMVTHTHTLLPYVLLWNQEAPQTSALTSLLAPAAVVAVVLVGVPQRFHRGLVGVEAFFGYLLHAQMHGCGGCRFSYVLFGVHLRAVWGLRRSCRLSAGISFACEQKPIGCFSTCEFTSRPFKNITAGSFYYHNDRLLRLFSTVLTSVCLF